MWIRPSILVISLIIEFLSKRHSQTDFNNEQAERNLWDATISAWRCMCCFLFSTPLWKNICDLRDSPSLRKEYHRRQRYCFFKVTQPVALIWKTCIIKMATLCVRSFVNLGLVGSFKNRMQFSSILSAEHCLVPTLSEVSEKPSFQINFSMTGNTTVTRRNPALYHPILGWMWHFIDDSWRI